MLRDPTISPHITVIVGSAGLRLLLTTYIQCRWPNARVEEIDPFSQTMPGSGVSPAFGTRSDLIVLGGIGTESEALSSLKRLRAKSHCPPIILVVSPILLASAATFLTAGANHVLNRESLSANRLNGAIHAQLNGGEALAHHVPTANAQIELVMAGQRHLVQFDGYESLSVLASTPLAQVIAAVDVNTRESAVIKIAVSAALHDYDALQRRCARFAMMAGLGTPHLVNVLDAGLVHSWPYMVMENLNGGDLRERMQAGLDPHEALRIVDGVLDALSAMHSGQLAHMDVKPENVRFRTDGTPVLIDYNIAVRFGESARHRQNQDVLGTPTYMSPEQGQGLAVDGRSDVYSVGVILYEMLTGQPPFAGENAAQVLFRHIHDEVPYLPRRVRQLQPVVDRCLEKHAADHFADVSELRSALASYRHLTSFAVDD